MTRQPKKQFESSKKQFVGYLKFSGPSVDEGKIDIEKIGNSLIALSKLYSKYSKQSGNEKVSLKLGKVKKKCTEVNIYFDQIVSIMQPAAQTLPYLMAAKTIGVTELGKQFFGTIGQQWALKLFSKGQKVEKIKEIAKDGKIFVIVKNADGEEQFIPKEIYDNQYDYAAPLRDLIQLEEKKEEKLEMGYYQETQAKKIAEVDYTQRAYFNGSVKETNLEDRLEEEFDESKTEDVKIVGKFVDYYGMAHKYHFSFQARKNQEEIGKQKILCILEGIEISKVIDLLKPENQEKNICIFGKATRNSEEKIDKIKIESVSRDEIFNTKQKKLIW